MKRRPLLALAAIAVTATVAGLTLAGGGASAATGRDTYSNCLKHAQSTFDMAQCVGNERKRLGPLLAAAYNKLLTRPGKSLIVRSQKAWLAYEKRDCAYAGNAAKGGTLQPILEGECLVSRTRTRIRDLKEFAVPLGR
jgi:uncharacterized protein YecT (DUF1311 family)